MKIKTADLIDAPLDWAVEQALLQSLPHPAMGVLIHRIGYGKAVKPYSTTGSEVIDIMEREGISVVFYPNLKVSMQTYPGYANLLWEAHMGTPAEYEHRRHGPTVRIAVCRCFVASQLGDEVEIPEELLK